MDSSDEDYLPDPERPRHEEPPDKSQVSGGRGLKRKNDEPANQQRGLFLHDDFTKGRCFLFSYYKAIKVKCVVTSKEKSKPEQSTSLADRVRSC